MKVSNSRIQMSKMNVGAVNHSEFKTAAATNLASERSADLC